MSRTLSSRELFLAAAALILGWSAHRTVQPLPPVHAASSDFTYQFSTIGPATGLSLYSESDRAIYVYQNVTGSNSHINCSYRLRVGHAGAPIDRENCAIGSLIR